MTERERAIDKARKIKALMEDTVESAPGESLAAKMKFDILMSKWGITDGELSAASILTETFDRLTPGVVWTTYVLTVVAMWFDCHASHNMVTGRSRLYGDRTGIDATTAGYEHVVRHVRHGMRMWKMMYAGWNLVETDEDYGMNIAITLRNRFNALKKGEEYNPFAYGEGKAEKPPEPEADPGSTALDVDRSELRAKALSLASSKPKAEAAVYEYVPDAEHLATIIPWPPAEWEHRQEPGRLVTRAGVLQDDQLTAQIDDYFDRRGDPSRR